MRRLLPPLLLLAVLGVVIARALSRPERESLRTRIEAYWEDTDKEGREKVVELTTKYAAEFEAEADRRFAAHAFLRARRLDKAVQARWLDLDGTLPPAEVKAFAQEALLAMGWDDEARQRPSIQNTQAVLALLEGGEPTTQAWMQKRIATEPVEELYVFMRRSVRLRLSSARTLLAAACRSRAAKEGANVSAAAGADPSWSVSAALLAYGPDDYPEKEDDLRLLLSVLDGPFRLLYVPRWSLACRALGSGEDPRALAALRALAERLSTSQDAQDRISLGTVQLALVAGGDWTHEAMLRKLFTGNEPSNRVLRTLAPEVIVDRIERGDARALPMLDHMWNVVGVSTPSVREMLARGLLLGPSLPPASVPVDTLLSDLELPDSPSYLVVLAKAFRHRRGEAGAREALVRWLAFDPGSGVAEETNPERATNPLLTALRALYLYD